MERFAKQVVTGGVALVAGLWLVEWFGVLTPVGGAGVALAVGGAVALGYGTGRELALGGDD